MSRLLSPLMAMVLCVAWAAPAEAGRVADIGQSVRNAGRRSLSGVKTLRRKAGDLGRRIGVLGQKVGAVGHKVGDFGRGVPGRVAPIKDAVARSYRSATQQRSQDRLFKAFYREIRAEQLGKGSVRRAYWAESLKRGVPFSAPGAIISGTVGVLAGVSAVIELSAGYLGDALTLGAISAAGLWGAKRLTQAKRRGKTFARGVLLARIAEAGALPEASLATELHYALSAYNKSDRLRLGQLEQRPAGTGLLDSLKSGWAKVKLPFARAKEKRSRKALERFEAAFAAPMTLAE